MSGPRQAAAVALFRQGGGGNPAEVFLVRRSRALAFLGGFHAFPGGSLDTTDAEIDVPDAPLERSYCAAAVRELFEEVGVLLAEGAAALGPDLLRALRRELLAGALSFRELLARHGLTVSGRRLTPIGQWVTPPYTPVVFHAHYLAAFLPEGQSPEIWPGELDDGAWVSPAEAIARHREGELFIAYPVLETLKVLAAHADDLPAAFAALDNRDNFYAHPGGEFITGVHIVPGRTPTLPPATHTNTYILGERDLVIVDPATPEPDEQDRFLTYLGWLRERGGVVREIWLTHHHADHTGAALRLRRELTVPVAAHPLTAERLAGKIPIDRPLEDGETIALARHSGPPTDWVVLHTPGHAPGHLCFYDPRLGSILTGDLVVSIGSVLIAPPRGNMRQYLASLARLRGLRLGFLFPGHGPPLATATEKVEAYIQHRLARERAILEALRDVHTPADLVRTVYADVDPVMHPLAELSVQAHLIKLEEEGRVMTRGGEWVLCGS